MRAANNEEGPVVAASVDRATLERIDAALTESEGQSPRLLTSAGESVELPSALIQLLRDAAHRLAEGQDVQLLVVDAELTTKQAADLLNVSRPYLIRLLDGGTLPHHYVGSHRRIRLADLMVYKRQRDTERRAALRELTQLSQDLELYDIPQQ